MALFLVAATPLSAARIQTAVETHYPTAHFKLTGGQWMISDNGRTAEQVWKALGLDDPELKPGVQAIIVGVGTYWGLHNRDLWPWMKEQLERQNG